MPRKARRDAPDLVALTVALTRLCPTLRNELQACAPTQLLRTHGAPPTSCPRNRVPYCPLAGEAPVHDLQVASPVMKSDARVMRTLSHRTVIPAKAGIQLSMTRVFGKAMKDVCVRYHARLPT